MLATKQNTIYLLILPFVAVLCTAFAVSDVLANGIIVAKYFWFYTSMAGVSLSALLAFAIQKQTIKITAIDCLVVLLALLILINKSNRIETQKYTHVALVILLYFYFRLFISQYSKSTFYLSLTFIVVALVESLWGLLQLYKYLPSYHGLFPITGSFFNPGPYSGFIAITLPLSLWYSLQISSKKYFLLTIYILNLVLALLVLPAAMSRGAWISMIAGCLLVIYFRFATPTCLQHFIQNKKKTTMFFVGALIIGMICVSMYGMYHLKKKSADGRLFIWKMAIEQIESQPMGVGLGHFSGAVGIKQANYFAEGKGSKEEESIAGNPEYAFNEYLQMGVELGIIVLSLFLSLIAIAIYRGIKKRKIGHVGALLSLLIFAFVSYPFQVLPFLIALAFLLATLSTSSSENDIPFTASTKKRMFQWSFLLLIISFTAFLLREKKEEYHAYKKWNEVKMLYISGRYKEAIEEYQSMLPWLSGESTYLFEYAQSLSKEGRYEDSNKQLLKLLAISCDPMLYNIMGKNDQSLKEYQQAEAYFLLASHLVPSRIYPYYLLANLYQEMGETEKAKSMAQIVLTKKPKVMSTAIKEMREKMKVIYNSQH